MEKQIVLITGASAGIGLSAAQMMMEQGFKVYAASRRGGEVQKASQGNGEIIPVKMDVNVESDIQQVIRQILLENGKLDAIISNAGNGIAGSVEDTSSEEVKYQLETNFFGAVKVIQACLPVFRQQGYGKIIATSSVAGVVPIPFQAFYSAGKAALLVFMQALALETKKFGIQCCTILPGDTKTEFTSSRKYTDASQSDASAYFGTMKRSVSKMEKDEQNGMPPSMIARAMISQLKRKKMKTQVVPRIDYKIICWLFKHLPASVSLRIVGMLYA